MPKRYGRWGNGVRSSWSPHNPDIAVPGDAELVVPLKSTHAAAVIGRGPIDTPATKAVARTIVGGSGQAFKMRHRIYGH